MFKKKKDEDRRQKVAIYRVVLSDARVEGDVERKACGNTERDGNWYTPPTVQYIRNLRFIAIAFAKRKWPF